MRKNVKLFQALAHSNIINSPFVELEKTVLFKENGEERRFEFKSVEPDLLGLFTRYSNGLSYVEFWNKDKVSISEFEVLV